MPEKSTITRRTIVDSAGIGLAAAAQLAAADATFATGQVYGSSGGSGRP
jgi:hypothetical protein